MEHVLLHKQDGYYTPWPQLNKLTDNRLVVGITTSPVGQHSAVGLLGKWSVLESRNSGKAWSTTDNIHVPHNWPAPTTREKQDRFVAIMTDGSYLCAGATGWELWPVERLREVNEKLRRYAKAGVTHEGKGKIVVGGQKLFTQRSTDGGETWSRREWIVPGFKFLLSFSRGTQLSNGTILIPLYGADSEREAGSPETDTRTTMAGRPYLWRSTDNGLNWRLLSLGSQTIGVADSETAFLEVSPGRVIALSRANPSDHDNAYIVQRWSEDHGLTWSQPLRTDIWGYPPHLLKLQDGRILCTYGYRRKPMGIRAVLSKDGGESWDTNNVIVLRDDGGTPSQLSHPPTGGASDLGYPMSSQTEDGNIITAYYITTLDGITHSAATRWIP